MGIDVQNHFLCKLNTDHTRKIIRNILTISAINECICLKSTEYHRFAPL